MRSIPLALAACLSLMLAESMIAKDVMKPPVSIVPGGYTVANCTQQAARHYGPNGRNVFIKIDQGEAVFHGLKERAGDKTPRYKLKNGKLEFQAPFYGTCGNLSIISVVNTKKGSLIKCHAAYIGEFELRLLTPKK